MDEITVTAGGDFRYQRRTLPLPQRHSYRCTIPSCTQRQSSIIVPRCPKHRRLRMVRVDNNDTSGGQRG